MVTMVDHGHTLTGESSRKTKSNSEFITILSEKESETSEKGQFTEKPNK